MEQSKKTTYIRARVTQNEKDKVSKLANSSSEDVSTYIRNAIKYRNHSELASLLAKSENESASGNYDQETLIPILNTLDDLLEQINGLKGNEEQELYESLVEWLRDYMNNSAKQYLQSNHNYEIPNDN
ncbi:hypothetical protein G5T19_02190 [Lactobacillus reuteri]|nr:hypothetical protein [Limosilactobacillus reuteri]